MFSIWKTFNFKPPELYFHLNEKKNKSQVFGQTSRRHDVGSDTPPRQGRGGSSRKQPKTGPRVLALNGLAPGHGRIADVARGRARPAYTMRGRTAKTPWSRKMLKFSVLRYFIGLFHFQSRTLFTTVVICYQKY